MTILKDLELSVRAHNVLLDYGKVHTLNDFLALTRAKVMSLPNAGVRTWEEIAHIQNALRAEALIQAPDDGGWTKHTPWYWSRHVDGERLDYWPSRSKWQFRGRVNHGAEDESAETNLAATEVQKEDLIALRDAAALAALQGYSANPVVIDSLQEIAHHRGHRRADLLAQVAWEAADAFIAARESKEK